jgi:hypothetical protein
VYKRPQWPQPSSDYLELLDAFLIHAESVPRAPKTVAAYREAGAYLGQFLAAHNLPQDVAEIKLTHLGQFKKYLLEHLCPLDGREPRQCAQGILSLSRRGGRGPRSVSSR